MKFIRFILLLIMVSPVLVSCGDDDGELSSAYVDSITTDYLRANRLESSQCLLTCLRKPDIWTCWIRKV